MNAAHLPRWSTVARLGHWLISVTLVLMLATDLIGAAGDVQFRAENLNISSGIKSVFATVDIFLDVDSVESIAANGWNLAAKLKPSDGAEGDVRFIVPTTGSHLPNLPPAKTNPFLQFDLTQNGKAYGSLGESPYEILAFAPLILPATDPPLMDSFGNIAIPSGAGLVSLPIEIAAGTSGDYTLSLVSTPQWTSVSYSIDQGSTEIAKHPIIGLVDGTIRIGSADLILCDFDANLTCDSIDIDLLNQKIRTNQLDLVFDLNHDLSVDEADRMYWVETLKGTYFGDANFDFQFDTTDLLVTFQAGQYEDQVDGNSGWATGDWDGSGDFDTGDLILAFQRNGFEQGVRGAVNVVPEPSVAWPSACALLLYRVTRRRSKPSRTRIVGR